MKKIVLFGLLLIILPVGGYYGYSIVQKELSNRETLFPYISTASLDRGVVGQSYMSKISGSLIGSNAELSIESPNLPSGLSISNCILTKNFDLLPKPNTVVSCEVVGVPENQDVYNVVFKVVAKNYANSTTANIPLIIN